MGWRHKNWQGYKQDIYNTHNTEEELVEAGADAMLKSLPRLKVENIYNTLVVDVLASAMIEHNVKAGYLVFIPSEED